ncbi:MAG TPA: hypothetical protein PK079_01440 [Leptospiraceae bacterium]|nr:hypothetical protein [Leptospiraceae bacterium]HMW04823.1 hypothetical protein [Leptospiraceae bacterium]HMX34923.1 hypothetical protein [Leptospiraceae bacterium]HMY30429.1 hypothetical protein [Leptospiraceae bacterium]HMZ64663.1 hypothetical protein [Leptospiraceae bacterium]
MINFNLDAFTKYVDLLKFIVEFIALLIGSGFGFYRFILKKEFHPKIQFSVELNVIDRTSKGWLVEVIAFIENKGSVRHLIDTNDFTFTIRYLTKKSNFSNDITIQKEKFYTLNFDNKVEDSTNKGYFQMLPNFFGETFIDPSVKQKYSCPLVILNDATHVLVISKFRYKDLSMDFHTAQGFYKLETNAKIEQKQNQGD